MIAKTHPFEGEQLTVAQICARVPALGETAVRSRLAAGCDSRQKMLAWDSKRALSEAGRRGRASSEAAGYLIKPGNAWRNARERASRD